MKMNIKQLILCAILAISSISSFAQSSGLEEFFYASGKIRVVIVVASIVMTGLLIYVFTLDRRLKKSTKKK